VTNAAASPLQKINGGRKTLNISSRDSGRSAPIGI
jgi:hypothetical protein